MFGSQLMASKMRNRSMPACGRLLDERVDDVVGVVRVADGVGGPQQHLEQDVRNLLAQLGQPVPRRLLEEPHGRVERRPAPHLQREQAGVLAGVARRDARACRAVRIRVASSDWWASRNVVSVTSSRFCSRTHCGELRRPQFA